MIKTIKKSYINHLNCLINFRFQNKNGNQNINWNTPLKIGELTLKNRIVLAAMTRRRTTQDDIPTKVMA